jgi:hypothetical protein
LASFEQGDASSMAGRSSTTFKKRQKELTRQDKARDKSTKREQRKQYKLVNGRDDGTYILDEDDPFAIDLSVAPTEKQHES